MGHQRVDPVASLLFCSLILLACSSVMAGKQETSIQDAIPSSLVLPQGDGVQQVLFATGVQIYVYNSTAWVLNNVSADLYNFKGLKVGFHYYLGEEDSNGGQPTWESYSPASRVTGKRLAGVSQDDSIDWLLIEATSHSDQPKFFGSTNFVQRIYTKNGLPPSADYFANEGNFFESAYTGLYTFSAEAHGVDEPSADF